MSALTWFKVDDGFWSHPKTATLSDAAVTLWVRAGAYSCQHLTDGRIDRPVLRLVGTEAAAAELVAVNLWIGDSGGWRFHDWDEYQETSETVKKRRDDARERQRRAREARELKRAVSQGESRVTDGVSNAVSSLPPTRPDPTRPTTSNEVVEGGPRKRGTRIPEPFMLTHDMREWAATEVPTVDVDASTRRFVDYWRADSGAKATKRDWVATWRNWLRRDADTRKPNRLTPAERAAQTAAAGRRVAGLNITSLEIEQ